MSEPRASYEQAIGDRLVNASTWLERHPRSLCALTVVALIAAVALVVVTW